MKNEKRKKEIQVENLNMTCGDKTVKDFKISNNVMVCDLCAGFDKVDDLRYK